MTPRLNGLDPLSLTALAGGRPVRPTVPGWKLLEPLGEGGLGVVWRATRESDGTHAAIKVPRAEDVSLVERLEVEARILESLDHPHIVRLLESGPLEGGSLYLALELVDGPPLSQCVPPTGYPAAEAYRLFRQISGAVAYAHSRQVLHRDLKPANILLDAAGNVRVADFGLAQSVAGRVQRLSLTLTGLVAGTAEYLPPEAYRADYKADAATDIYARFTAEPFETGYGYTIGNSLRRVLLSSLEGAAITSFKVDGAMHEWPPMPRPSPATRTPPRRRPERSRRAAPNR